VGSVNQVVLVGDFVDATIGPTREVSGTVASAGVAGAASVTVRVGGLTASRLSGVLGGIAVTGAVGPVALHGEVDCGV